MARLVHLKGPPRVGKSTLARRCANEHPGVLALDLDVLADLVDRIRRHLDDYLAGRPGTIRLDTTGIGVDASCQHLLEALTS